MREFLSMLLTCSATMSALGLLYMALTTLLTRRYSAGSRYYAWLIIVIGLMIPFRPRLGSSFVAYHLPLESKFGEEKTCYGLGHLFARLQVTSECAIHCFVANLNRSLRLLFAHWRLCWVVLEVGLVE